MSRHLESTLNRVFGEQLLSDPRLSEIVLNPDGRVWVERSGDSAMKQLTNPLSEDDAQALAQDLAGDNPISAKTPLAGSQFEISGSLWRAQVAVKPAVEDGVAFALRRAVAKEMSLDQLMSGLPDFKASMADLKTGVDPADVTVFEAYENGGFGAFLRAAVKAKWNILLSGGTSSGKTTWLRACLAEVDAAERIMTIEDVLEIRPSQPNAVSLIVNKATSSRDLLKACLRFRPERIIMGELRGSEAYDFLSAINSGHPGGISTLHAASPESALSRLALMVLQADTGLTYSEILEYCRTMIDVIVQFRKTGDQRLPVAVRVLRQN
ncbi:ATPase, T2SS/T4P/T4SS family [Sedimentitalea sp.]|uniref:ATPase, T2SS/T4P/T4SS family n=1 Tax=Sedimentitalea sp. TaxID=2048915 RepID=UPI003297D550